MSPSSTFSGKNSLLADIIQISFYQKSGWHNRWRYKKYAADKQRILMRDRDFCISMKGMEITILIPDTLNCTLSPWVIVRRRYKCQLQNFLYYWGWHQNFLFEESCLGSNKAARWTGVLINKQKVIPAGMLVDSKTNIRFHQPQCPAEMLQCAGGARRSSGAGLPVCSAKPWNSPRKEFTPGKTQLVTKKHFWEILMKNVSSVALVQCHLK